MECDDKLKWSSYITETFKIIGALFLIQLIRMIVSLSIYDNSSDIVVTTVKILVLMLLLGILIVMAKKERVSFSLFLVSNNIKFIMVYSIISVILVFMVITMPAFTCGYTLKVLIPFVYAVMIIPIFEELLFRGFLWEKSKAIFNDIWKVFIFILFLYLIWSISSFGGLDYLNQSILGGEIHAGILKRAAIGGLLGTTLGFTRMISKNTFTCILLHSIINICIIFI